MINFKNIKKTYGQQTIIKDMSFSINKGELVVLIGLSGSGKTTLLKMINRLIKATSGQILINGEDIMDKDEIKLRRNIGYVIQQTGLFPHMTIRENIEIIPKLLKKDKNKIINKSIELMDMVGLDANLYLDKYPIQLSGGQQQRVGVARAFAINPDIILMDEPFSALDPITRNQLQDELVELQSKIKKTIVFVTHDMDEAVKIADRICLLNKGEIVQYDTPEEIMKNPINEFAMEFIGKNRIWSSPEFIRSKDIMIQNPVCASAELTALRCVERMRSQKVDRLLITNKNKKLLGIITAKKIQALEDKSVLVADIMTTEFKKVGEEDNVIDILQIFNTEKLSAIPVTDKENKLQGLITKSSLLTTLSQQFMDLSEVI